MLSKYKNTFNHITHYTQPCSPCSTTQKIKYRLSTVCLVLTSRTLVLWARARVERAKSRRDTTRQFGDRSRLLGYNFGNLEFSHTFGAINYPCCTTPPPPQPKKRVLPSNILYCREGDLKNTRMQNITEVLHAVIPGSFTRVMPTANTDYNDQIPNSLGQKTSSTTALPD